VEGDEALPLPGHRFDAEQVAEGGGVGAGVGHHDDPAGRVVEVPEGGLVVDPLAADGVEVPLQAGGDPDVEVAEGLPAGDALPVVVDRPAPALGEDLLHDLDGLVLPDRGGDLGQPVERGGGHLQRVGDVAGGLLGPHERRDDQRVDLGPPEALADEAALGVAEVGETGVVDAATLTGPRRLCMSDEEELHGDDTIGWV
jgi:hypothetical protein